MNILTPYRFSSGGGEWTIEGMTYNGKTLWLGGWSSLPSKVWFKPDGTVMFFYHISSSLYQLSLSTPWDVTTGTFVKYKSMSSFGFAVKNSGDLMVAAYNDKLYKRILSTPWDIITATYINSKYIGDNEQHPYGVFFSPSGKRMFICGFLSNKNFQYTLSTAWDITTATYDNIYLDLAVILSTNNFRGIYFKPDGLSVYVVSTTTDNVYELSL